MTLTRRIEKLYVYPLKSGRGIRVLSVYLGRRGFESDRAWMVVDEHGNMVSQRDAPKMAQLITHLFPGGMSLNVFRGDANLVLPRVEQVSVELTPVQVWEKTFLARDCGTDAATWMSDFLRRKVRVVYLPEDVSIPSKRNEKGEWVERGFADGFPLLVTSDESIADLSERSGVRLTHERFRPNIVVSGCDSPYEEDRWREFSVRDIGFRGMKRCTRCAITTKDPKTGKSLGPEPLKTLMKYRNVRGKLLFGMNVNHLDEGTIKVGDLIHVPRLGRLPRL